MGERLQQERCRCSLQTYVYTSITMYIYLCQAVAFFRSFFLCSPQPYEKGQLVLLPSISYTPSLLASIYSLLYLSIQLESLCLSISLSPFLPSILSFYLYLPISLLTYPQNTSTSLASPEWIYPFSLVLVLLVPLLLHHLSTLFSISFSRLSIFSFSFFLQVCPGGSLQGDFCPFGSYLYVPSGKVPDSLQTACAPCPRGRYCRAGVIAGLCAAG